jgi:hypothetical protein
MAINDDFIDGFRAGINVCVKTVRLLGLEPVASALESGSELAISEFMELLDNDER